MNAQGLLYQWIAIFIHNNCFLGHVTVFCKDLGVGVVERNRTGHIHAWRHEGGADKLCQINILGKVDTRAVRQCFHH